MSKKLRARPSPGMRQTSKTAASEHMVGSNGVKIVHIEDPVQAAVLKALNRKWTSTENRINHECANIKRAAEAQINALFAQRQAEQADFIQECSAVALPLGLDLQDESLSVRYDDERAAFLVSQKATTAAQGPVEVPIPATDDEEAEEIEELDAVSEAAEGMDADAEGQS